MSIQWAFVVFKLLAGTGAGLLGFVGLAELIGRKSDTTRKVLMVSLVLLLIAGCAALLQVGKPERIMSVVRNLSLDSPVSWELLSYGIAVLVGILYTLLSRSKNALVKGVAALAIIVAVAVGFTSGYSHMSMVGMPSWHNAVIPVAFLTSSLLLGGVTYLAFSGKTADKTDNSPISNIVLVLAALAAISYCAYGFTANLGDYMLIYWLSAPLIGGVVSIVSLALEKVKDSVTWLYCGALAALVGAVAFRALIWSIVETGLRTGDSIVHI